MIRVAVILMLAAFPLAAQSVAPLCWTAKPLPDCRAWLVTDFGVEYGVLTTRMDGTEGNDFEARWVLTLGRMSNRSTETSRGYNLGLGFADGDPYIRGELRHRRWYSAKLASDASVGLARQKIRANPFGQLHWAHGLTAAGGMEFDWIALDGRGEVLYGRGRTATGLSLALRTTGKQGAAAFGVFAAGTIWIAVAILRGGGISGDR